MDELNFDCLFCLKFSLIRYSQFCAIVNHCKTLQQHSCWRLERIQTRTFCFALLQLICPNNKQECKKNWRHPIEVRISFCKCLWSFLLLFWTEKQDALYVTWACTKQMSSWHNCHLIDAILGCDSSLLQSCNFYFSPSFCCCTFGNILHGPLYCSVIWDLKWIFGEESYRKALAGIYWYCCTVTIAPGCLAVQHFCQNLFLLWMV